MNPLTLWQRMSITRKKCHLEFMGPCAVSILTHHLCWGWSSRYTRTYDSFYFTSQHLAEGLYVLFDLVFASSTFSFLIPPCFSSATWPWQRSVGGSLFPWPPPSHDMRWWTAGSGDIHLTHTPPLLPYTGSPIASSLSRSSLIYLRWGNENIVVETPNVLFRIP